MTRPQLADALTTLAVKQDPRHPGISVYMIKTWETGLARPRRSDAAYDALRELTGMSAEQLGLADAATMPPERYRSVDLEGQIAMAARRALRFIAAAEGNAVGPETLTQVHEEVRRLTALYPSVSLGTIMGDLVETQDVIFHLLEAHPRPLDARDLYLLASIASGMLAKASHDLGDPRSAMSQARTAYVCADSAGHDGMRGWVCGLQSLIAYWAGRYQEAAAHARRGLAMAGEHAGTCRVWLASLDARASAALTDRDATGAAIALARDALEHGSADDLDAFGGIMTFPRPRQLYYAAEATVMLGDDMPQARLDAACAVEAYQQAQADEWAFADQAGAHTNLAVAMLHTKELDGAAQAMRLVLDLPSEQRCHGVIVSANRVHHALRSGRLGASAGARAMIAEIEEFTRAPIAAIGG